MTVAEFWASFSPCPITGCWWWTGASGGNRYATATVDGRRDSVHRHVVRLTTGEFPPGRRGHPNPVYACHRCNQKACGNPEHVYRGSASTNSRDQLKVPGFAKRRGDALARNIRARSLMYAQMGPPTPERYARATALLRAIEDDARARAAELRMRSDAA